MVGRWIDHLDSLHVERRRNHTAVARPLIPGEPRQPLAKELPCERVPAAKAGLVEGLRGISHHSSHNVMVGDHQPGPGAEPVHERAAVPRRPLVVVRHDTGEDASVVEGSKGRRGLGTLQHCAELGRVAGEQPAWGTLDAL